MSLRIPAVFALPLILASTAPAVPVSGKIFNLKSQGHPDLNRVVVTVRNAAGPTQTIALDLTLGGLAVVYERDASGNPVRDAAGNPVVAHHTYNFDFDASRVDRTNGVIDVEMQGFGGGRFVPVRLSNLYPFQASIALDVVMPKENAGAVTPGPGAGSVPEPGAGGLAQGQGYPMPYVACPPPVVLVPAPCQGHRGGMMGLFRRGR